MFVCRHPYLLPIGEWFVTFQMWLNAPDCLINIELLMMWFFEIWLIFKSLLLSLELSFYLRFITSFMFYHGLELSRPSFSTGSFDWFLFFFLPHVALTLSGPSRNTGQMTTRLAFRSFFSTRLSNGHVIWLYQHKPYTDCTRNIQQDWIVFVGK